MRMPRGLREYERTCDECGTAWKVPKAIAKRKRRIRLRGTVGAVGIVNAGTLPYGGPPPDFRDIAMINRNLPSNAAAQRAIEDLGKCPQCGSEEYSQRPFRP